MTTRSPEAWAQTPIDGGTGADVLFGQAVYDTFYAGGGDPGTIVDDVLNL